MTIAEDVPLNQLLEQAQEASKALPPAQAAAFWHNLMTFAARQRDRSLRETAVALRRALRYTEALQIVLSLLKAAPNDARLHVFAADCYRYGRSDFARAAAHYLRASELKPDDLKASLGYIECESNNRTGDEGANFEKAYRAALALLQKGTPTPNVAGALQSVFLRAVDYESYDALGDHNALMHAWAANNQPGRLHQCLARVKSDEDRQALLNAHMLWGQRTESLPKVLPPAAPRVRRRRKKRIALLSSDLRHHPVTYFVQPWTEHYNRDQFELFCYSFYPGKADRVQQELAESVDAFNVLSHLNNDQAAARIALDAPDVLFELGGTTHLNRAELLTYRLAPTQVSWLGYPHSLGLPSVDYLLTDPYLGADFICEKPLAMPETWVTLGQLGFHEQPIHEELPQERHGCLTFGTFNQPYKYTEAGFNAWAGVMRAVPNARFLFVRPESSSQSFTDNIKRQFARRDVDPSRIVFRAVRGNHMRHYNDIDIALDTLPHTGGTTTCETLWMGVPVVTMVGSAFFERISYSNLCNAGLDDLCAFNLGDYIKIAVGLAADQARRKALRTGLRERIMSRPLGQSRRFVQGLEQRLSSL